MSKEILGTDIAAEMGFADGIEYSNRIAVIQQHIEGLELVEADKLNLGLNWEETLQDYRKNVQRAYNSAVQLLDLRVKTEEKRKNLRAGLDKLLQDLVKVYTDVTYSLAMEKYYPGERALSEKPRDWGRA